MRPEMSPRIRALLLQAFIVGVLFAGSVSFFNAFQSSRGQAALGRYPVAFLLYAFLVFLAEVRPLTWVDENGGGQLTVSWTFAFALLFLAPRFSALLAIAAAGLLTELLHRKRVIRVLFNAAQITLSLGLGIAALSLVSNPGKVISPGGPSWRWLTGMVLAGITALVVNSLVTCFAISLSQALPLRAVLRQATSVSIVVDGLLTLLAPVFVVVTVHGALLVPLLLLAIVGIYKSFQIALNHRHEATHDLLTGIANRRSFYSQASTAIEESRRSGHKISVLHLDLDGFKGINDRLGHYVGDLVLCEVARRLSFDRAPTDFVARLGGDEFAMVVTASSTLESAAFVADAVLNRLQEPFVVEGVPIAIAGSIGVALYPDHGLDIDTLLHHADVAMYRAKTHKGGTQIYDQVADRNGPTRLGLLGELTRAIAQNELILYYQPKVDIATGTISGVEALIRWNHPVRGLLPPDQFIIAAEQTDLMGPLTAYVLRKALHQCAQWHEAGMLVTVAVNASARNLHDLGFPDAVRDALASAGIDGTWLEIEITENTVMTDPARSGEVLSQLRALGVQLSIDDFGTGYSSLASLRSLPIDRIKIDKSFVMNMANRPEDATIVRSIIELAHNLGLGTIAEGVEDLNVLRMLRTLGCDQIQGHLLAPPEPAEKITPMLASQASSLAMIIDGDQR